MAARVHLLLEAGNLLIERAGLTYWYWIFRYQVSMPEIDTKFRHQDVYGRGLFYAHAQ